MTQIDIAALVADLTTKSAMINMGEKIAWGSETTLMDQAVAALIAQDAELKRLWFIEGVMHGIANELSWAPKTREISDRIRAALGEKP